MIVRIVRMTFKKENIPSFERIFDQNKEKIRNVTGCNFLELYQDVDEPEIFFTYSYWSRPEDLENYRNSELFAEIWKQTRSLFALPAAAWSVTKKHTLS